MSQQPEATPPDSFIDELKYTLACNAIELAQEVADLRTINTRLLSVLEAYNEAGVGMSTDHEKQIRAWTMANAAIAAAKGEKA